MLFVIASRDWKDCAGLSPVTPLVCHLYDDEVVGKLEQAQTRSPKLADEKLYKGGCRMPVRPTGRPRDVQDSWRPLHLPIEEGITNLALSEFQQSKV